MTQSTGKAGCFRRWKQVIILFLFGLLLIAFAGSMKVIVSQIFQSEIKAQLVLKPDNTSSRYQQWKFPTVPIHMEFYVFDIVNEFEVKQGKSPVVSQLGPYTYRESLSKKNISFDKEQPAVSYNEETSFIFVKELSCESCDPYNDFITTINIPYAILSEVARGYPAIVRFAIDLLLIGNKEDLIMRRTVQDLIWGYNDSIFEELAELKKRLHLSFMPDISPFMNLQPNNSFNGEVTVNTGKHDIKTVASWEKWNGKSNVGLWKTIYANMLNGSDGTQFAPGTTRKDQLYFFSPNLCRSIYLRYDKQHSIKGIDVYRFTTPESIFQNSTYDPDNEAFCLHRCYPNGILAGTRDCKPSTVESPIVISTPHFLLGDPYLRQQVGGLSPNRESHGLFLSIEPMTGIPLQALVRLQINLHIQEVDDISGTKGIKESYVPVMYFNNNATIDDGTAKMLRNDIMIPLSVCFYLEIGIFCLGSLLVLLAGVMLIKGLR
jgi:hypothetical protein